MKPTTSINPTVGASRSNQLPTNRTLDKLKRIHKDIRTFKMYSKAPKLRKRLPQDQNSGTYSLNSQVCANFAQT